MTERKKIGRGLADISHYFITEPKPTPEACPPLTDAIPAAAVEVAPPVAAVEPAPQLHPARHFFLLGSRSLEARSLVASNLACAWSAEGFAVEMVEGEKRIPNSHFLMGSLFPQNGDNKPNGHPLLLRLDAARVITLSSWEHPQGEMSAAPKQIIWNGPLPLVLKAIARVETAPRVLVVLEPDRVKLMEAYVELRQAAAARPDAQFGAIVYARGAENGSAEVFSFFQKMCLKYVQVAVRDCGRLPWDLTLAKSILSRLPAVLHPEESSAKEAIHFLAKTWRE